MIHVPIEGEIVWEFADDNGIQKRSTGRHPRIIADREHDDSSVRVTVEATEPGEADREFRLTPDEARDLGAVLTHLAKAQEERWS